MAVYLSLFAGAGQQFFTNAGVPLAGGKIYTYGAGGSTPQATYTTSAGNIAHSNPIQLDAAGRVPGGGEIWLTDTLVYKFQLETSTGTIIQTLDNVSASIGSAALLASSGSNLIGFIATGSGASARTVQGKLRDTVSIRDFGAVGDGLNDDTIAIQNALNASKHVIVPAGMTCLISSTITVPSQTRLQFLGGIGNLSGAMPASYFIKKSTMTTVGILISQRGVVDGGGLLCQAGNTGDGVQLIGNAAMLSDFIVVGAGRDGVLVGDTGALANANSTVVQYVKARENGRHGIYVHHDNIVGIANANAGTLLQCTAIDNTQDGIRIGHAFWVSIINCLTEINGGWGLYLSGINNDSYPECRWTTVVGGDYNEGNITGQVYDGSYFATFFQPDATSLPTTAPTGLQGGGYRSAITASGNSTLQGLTVQTDVIGAALRPLTVNAGTASGVTYPSRIAQITTATNGDGVGLAFRVDPATGTYINASQISTVQQAGGKHSLKFDVYYGAAVVGAARFNSDALAFHPETNNVWSLGRAGQRWSEVFAINGTINTSDAREKQQVRELSDAERAVAVRLKSLIRAFKWNDAVDKKGDNARIHVGVMAQEVKAAFEAEGLNADEYGVFCYNAWDDEFEPEYETQIVQEPDGKKSEIQVATGKLKLARAAGDAFGVRYEQLFAFIIAAL